MFDTKSKSTQALAIIFLVIVTLLPFHALISTWAISNFGFETLFKAWKELLLIFVAVPLVIFIAFKDKKIANSLIKSRVNQLIAGFVLLNLLLILVGDNPAKVQVAGLVFNLRFFAMFLIAQILALKLAKSRYKELVLNLVFWCGAVVVVFGALQVLALPNDFLRHFGYQQSIIPPYLTVDNNENLVRILSTLRGPNVLGAYLVLWLPFLAYATKRMLLKFEVNWRVLLIVGLWLCSLVTLFASRSRSGWLGAVIALGIFVLLSVGKKWQKRLIIAGIASALSLLSILVFNWNSSFVQTTLKHRDPSESSAVNSDDQRTGSLMSSLKAIAANPLGSGPGSVNLASTYGDKPIIVENYYLQVAQELGIIGLILFVAILVMVVLQLWRIKQQTIAVVLLAGFAGIAVVNLLLPGWGDETVSMLWWGATGLVIAPVAVKSKKHAKV